MKTGADPCRPGPAAAEEHALARSVIYRFLSAAFRHPGGGTLATLRELEEGLREATGVLASGPGEKPLRPACLRVTEALGEAPPAELEEDHIALFGYAVQGPCPPYEGEYSESEEGLRQPHELADLAAFYRAFGLRVSREARERLDFIGVECDYLAFLCRKEAFALEERDTEMAAVVRDHEKAFLDDHLARWIPAFTRRLAEQAGDGFYRSLARFTLEFITRECERFRVRPGSEHLRVRIPLDDPDTALECPFSLQGTGPEPAAGGDFEV